MALGMLQQQSRRDERTKLHDELFTYYSQVLHRFFTLCPQDIHMLNRRLAGSVKQWLPMGQLLTALVLAIQTSGCISHRPAPLLIERQAREPEGSQTRAELQLKVLTFNIWGLPSWMTGARRGRYPQIARELQRLDPDIILLQEAWTAKARKAAPQDGRWSIARAAGQHTFFQQCGLVTLSKFPVVGGEFYPFSRASFPDRFVRKGVLKVTVRLPGGRLLNVWNVHLQDGGTIAVQRSQIRELLSHVEAAQDRQIADLVGGDFNCTPESPLWRELQNALGPSVQELGEVEPFLTWDGLSSKPGAGQTLDYIFMRQCSSFQEVQAVPRLVFAAKNLEQRLSDHLGIEAEMSLSPAPSLAGPIGPQLQSALTPSLARSHVTTLGRE
jgi:endonuclease/exonuclease/phosphatase family metal-dependent hydrolase